MQQNVSLVKRLQSRKTTTI